MPRFKPAAGAKIRVSLPGVHKPIAGCSHEARIALAGAGFSAAAPTPPPRGFTLTELLVTTAIIMALASMTAAAVAAAGANRKKLQTRTLIAKLDSIVAAQYASYASRNVDVAPGTTRGETLRTIARGDLPDDWSTVAALAGKSSADLTIHQRAYAAIWNSISDAKRQIVPAEHSDAECLFLAVMHGGLSDCLDCESLRIDVGDDDGDGMPEFLDAWNNPVGFILEPQKLQLPPGSGKTFFSSTLPFDPVVATSLDAKGGMMRPLIVSAGPNGAFGLEADALPIPGSVDHLDNLTNFDAEARP